MAHNNNPGIPDAGTEDARVISETCAFCEKPVMVAAGTAWWQCSSCMQITTADEGTDSRSCNYCREPVTVCGGCGGWYCTRVRAQFNAEERGKRKVPVDRHTRCDIPLFTTDPNVPLPDHWCNDAAFESVRRFKDEHFAPGKYAPTNLLTDSMTPGPIPAGAQSLAVYAERYKFPLDALLPPLLPDDPTAWVGLVVRRQTSAGKATLYGLVEPVTTDGATLWAYVDARVITSNAAPEVHKQARLLHRWFEDNVVRVSPRGRRPGNTYERDDARKAYDQAILDCLREHDKLIYKNVANHMSISGSTLYYYRGQYALEKLSTAVARLRPKRKS